MGWFVAVCLLGSAALFWEYRCPTQALRLTRGFPQPEDLTPRGMRRLQIRFLFGAVLLLVVAAGALVLGWAGAFDDDDREQVGVADTEYERCVQTERGNQQGRDVPGRASPEELCEIMYPDG